MPPPSLKRGMTDRERKVENRFQNFTMSILRIHKLIQRIKLLEMDEYGLKAIHVMCLYLLNEHEGGLTAGDLIRYTLEDKAAISRGVKLLKEKGYVEQDEHKNNSLIKLTPSGKTIADLVIQKAERAVAFGGQNLEEETRETLYAALADIADNLGEYYKNLAETKK